MRDFNQELSDLMSAISATKREIKDLHGTGNKIQASIRMTDLVSLYIVLECMVKSRQEAELNKGEAA